MRRVVVVGSVWFAAAALAVPALEGVLAPAPGLEPPGPDVKAQVAELKRPEACQAEDPRVLPKRPFGPGEVLEYEADVLGYDVAVLKSRVEAPVTLGGEEVLPVYAEVHSDLVLRVAASLDAEMRTWLDPDSLRPRRYAWRVRATSPKTDFYARSDAAFAKDGKVGFASHLVTKQIGKDEHEERKEGVLALPPGVLDVLSVVYHARSRVLDVGTVLCPPVQLGGGAAALVGTVVGREVVDVDYDERTAFKIEIGDAGGRIDRELKVHAWISDDEERLPLRLFIENDRGALDLELDDVDR